MHRGIVTICFLVVVTGTCVGESRFAVGERISLIHAAFGPPNRTVDTGDGHVMFYGATLIFVKNGIVDFVSVGGSLPPPTVPPSDPDTGARQERNPSQDPVTISWDPERKGLPDREPHERRFVARVKRYAVLKGYHSLRSRFRSALPPLDANGLVALKDARGNLIPSYGEDLLPYWYTLNIRVRESIEPVSSGLAPL